LKENKLVKAKLTFTKREMLITFILIKFNDEIISLTKIINKDNRNSIIKNDKNDYNLSFFYFSQCDQIRLINIFISIDLISSRD
jgi:hypothetical protein